MTEQLAEQHAVKDLHGHLLHQQTGDVHSTVHCSTPAPSSNHFPHAQCRLGGAAQHAPLPDDTQKYLPDSHRPGQVHYRSHIAPEVWRQALHQDARLELLELANRTRKVVRPPIWQIISILHAIWLQMTLANQSRSAPGPCPSEPAAHQACLEPRKALTTEVSTM